MRLLHYSDLENASDDPGRAGRLAAVLAGRAGPDAAVLDGGDALAPSLLGDETEGRHVPELHRTLGTDVAAVGNHDFDHGLDALLAVAAETPATYLAANLRVDGEPLAARPGVERRTVVGGGRRVGLVGVTTRETVAEHPGADGVTVDPVVPTVRSATADLREAGVEHVVVLSHAGHDDRAIARACPVAAVLGGHVHTPLVERVEGTVLARPGARGRRVVELDLANARVLVHRTDAWPVEGTVAASVRERRAGLGLETPVATLDRPLERSTDRLFPESRVGNLVADAYRRAAGADVALFNVGMLRAGPPLGETVTVGDCRSLTPFDDQIHSSTLSGGGLRALFADVATLSEGLAAGEVHAHLSGAAVRYRHDPDDDRPWRLLSASVDGDPLVDDREYRVAAPTFAFERGFEALGEYDRTHVHQHEALREHLRERGSVPAVTGRVVVEEA
jgi:2',3'-cyclic-nucleotide 2'-phosphodiesterase (5'-nucleotidase family)